jgi:hypothetical protein
MTDRRERRSAVRLTSAAEHGIRFIRIRPGHGAALINVSAAGALIETHRRLLPGSLVEIQMETDRHKTSVRGVVVHCFVARVGPACVAYRGAIEFDRRLPWFAPDDGYLLPGMEHGPAVTDRADVTHPTI